LPPPFKYCCSRSRSTSLHSSAGSSFFSNCSYGRLNDRHLRSPGPHQLGFHQEDERNGPCGRRIETNGDMTRKVLTEISDQFHKLATARCRTAILSTASTNIRCDGLDALFQTIGFEGRRLARITGANAPYILPSTQMVQFRYRSARRPP